MDEFVPSVRSHVVSSVDVHMVIHIMVPGPLLVRKRAHAQRGTGNVGDKRVKRRRGSRSAAAVAAQIERGYLNRTAGGIACREQPCRLQKNRWQPSQQLNTRLQQNTAVTIFTSERKPRTTSAELDKHSRTANADGSGPHTGER